MSSEESDSDSCDSLWENSSLSGDEVNLDDFPSDSHQLQLYQFEPVIKEINTKDIPPATEELILSVKSRRKSR